MFHVKHSNYSNAFLLLIRQQVGLSIRTGLPDREAVGPPWVRAEELDQPC
jgi:hypothetical protein